MHVLLCQWLIALKTFFRPAGAVEGGGEGRRGCREIEKGRRERERERGRERKERERERER